MTHIPELAADGAAQPHRALVLAGGGMRVAYQAGVLRAFAEEGMRFTHADGASGGTINLAMMLSGLSADEMCERWSTVDVKDFVSLLPLRRYFRGPSQLGYGDADGIVEKVYPHLGIDVERIRAARGIDGTFNVVDYGAKVNEAIPHTEIDLDLLIAAISLPIMMPPVATRGGTYTDSVWIKDANVTEAARRGASEIWLVWCIGNTNIWRKGMLNQYVHMIELSANGSLGEELRAIGERPNPPVLHVIKPEYPIPLDPDFFVGRVSASALIAMGYRDARRYLADVPPAGVPLNAESTRMSDPGRGVAFTERWSGRLAGDGRISVDLRVDIPDLDAFVAGPEREAAAAGWIDVPGLERPAIASEGTFVVGPDGGSAYELAFLDRGHSCSLSVTRRKGGRRATATLRGRGDTPLEAELRRSPRGRLGFLRNVHATTADRVSERVAAVARFARFALPRL